MLKRTTVPLLAACGLLALPASGLAAETVGSDLLRADAPNARLMTCTDAPTQQPCTLVADQQPWQISLPGDHIVTRFSAYVSSGAQLRLRILRRNGDGTFTGAGASATMTAPDEGIHAFTTHLAVPQGEYAFGVDLLSGRIGAVSDDMFTTGVIAPVLGAAETRTPAQGHVELLANASVETDYDQDGKADDTEDDCPGTCPGSGGGPADPGAGPQPGAPAPVADGTSYPIAPPRQEERSTTPTEPPFTIEKTALLRPGKEGRSGWFEVYTKNTGSGDADAEIQLKAGRKVIGTEKETEIDSGDEALFRFRLSAALRKQLARRHKLGLSLVAKVRRASGAETYRTPVKLIRGGASKYDGYYKGTGGLVFVVAGGAVRTITGDVYAFCPSTNRHQMLSLFSLDGVPPIVAPDGSFNVTGRGGGQQMTYKGKLKVRGKSTGYASAYRFQLGIGAGGRYFTDGCTGAVNWTATRRKG